MQGFFPHFELFDFSYDFDETKSSSIPKNEEARCSELAKRSCSSAHACSEIGQKWFQVWFTVSGFVDSLDEAVLTALQDGKPGVFVQLLDRTGISHNTLRLHLEKLVKQGLVAREKTPVTGLGRPKFAYVIPQRVRRQVSTALSDPFIEIISLPFSRLKHLCRFEKGGYCKELRKACEAQNCPQIKK